MCVVSPVLFEVLAMPGGAVVVGALPEGNPMICLAMTENGRRLSAEVAF